MPPFSVIDSAFAVTCARSHCAVCLVRASCVGRPPLGPVPRWIESCVTFCRLRSLRIRSAGAGSAASGAASGNADRAPRGPAPWTAFSPSSASDRCVLVSIDRLLAGFRCWELACTRAVSVAPHRAWFQSPGFAALGASVRVLVLAAWLVADRYCVVRSQFVVNTLIHSSDLSGQGALPVSRFRLVCVCVCVRHRLHC
jgi:hypothetical protein